MKMTLRYYTVAKAETYHEQITLYIPEYCLEFWPSEDLNLV